jgi:competence protein ComEC
MRLFVVCLVIGAWALQHEAELPRLRLELLGIALLLACHWVAPHRRAVRVLLLAGSGALVGFGYSAWRAEARLADALPAAAEGRDLELVGIVAGLPQLTERGTRFVFHVESAGAAPRVVSLMWHAGPSRPALVPGQRWKLTARLKRPRGLSNPHAFDFAPWALERRIRAAGYVRGTPAPQLVTARADGWPQTLHRWRDTIRDVLLSRLGEGRMRGVLVALAIGDQDAIAAGDWDLFWRTGVGHLMSISGLHITMLAGLAFLASRFLWALAPPLALRLPARKAGMMTGVAVALGYTLLTGYAVPAQRTFCMLAVMALCVLADRHGSPSRVLALAVLAVIAFDPWAVLAPGFWLSFGAVAAIFYGMALRTGHHGVLRAACREQLIVTVAMLPMLVALFHEFPLVSPLANAIAIPVVSLAVVPLTLAGTLLPAALDAAHALMVLVVSALEWLGALPGAMLETHAPRAWTVVAALAGCAWLLAPRGVPLRSFGAFWLAPLFLVLPAQPRHGEAWIDVLDVGSGLALIVRTASHALAYDAGPSWSGNSDSGKRIVVPFLRGEGVARLSGQVVSHADDDHAGGAVSVAASRRPAWLLSSLAATHALHGMVPHSVGCEAGQRWEWDGVEFDVLHPHGDRVFRRGGSPKVRENDRSCVLRVQAAGASMLLTGDIEARSEAEMLARGARLRADVLLVPHHGSRTSSTAAFLDAVRPRLAIVSAGYRNRFGHPHPVVLARYGARGIGVRRTDHDGALRVVLPADSRRAIEVRGHGWQRRYWSDHRPPAGDAPGRPRKPGRGELW